MQSFLCTRVFEIKASVLANMHVMKGTAVTISKVVTRLWPPSHTGVTRWQKDGDKLTSDGLSEVDYLFR